MIVHEIITINKTLKSDFLYKIYSKNLNNFMGEYPKYIMQYLDMTWENKRIFTFSRKLEVMSNN